MPQMVGSLLDMPTFVDTGTIGDVSTSEQDSNTPKPPACLSPSVTVVEPEEPMSSFEIKEADSKVQVHRKKSVQKVDCGGETEPMSVIGEGRGWAEPTLIREMGEDEDKMIQVKHAQQEEKTAAVPVTVAGTRVSNSDKQAEIRHFKKDENKKEVFTHIRSKSIEKKTHPTSSSEDVTVVNQCRTPRGSRSSLAVKPWETPKSKRKGKGNPSSKKNVSGPAYEFSDPYVYHMSQSQRDEEERQQVVKGFKDRANDGKQVSMLSLFCLVCV